MVRSDPSEITAGEGDSDMGNVTEDVDVDEDTNNLETTGSLTISDPDTNDIHLHLTQPVSLNQLVRPMLHL